MLTYQTQVEPAKLRCKTGLFALKTMAAKGICTCCISPACWRSPGCKTEPWESFWKQQKTHSLRPCATYWTCHPWKQDTKWSKSKRISMRCRNPRIHSMMLEKKTKGVDGPSRTVNPACVRPHRAQASKGLEKKSAWVQTLLQDSGRQALPWMASWKTQCRSTDACRNQQQTTWHRDLHRSTGWGFTVKQGGRIVHEDNGTHRATTSSLTVEVEAITHVIAFQRDAHITHAIILTDSMNQLQKEESGIGCPDWHTAMQCLLLQRLLWTHCLVHARVCGNDRADRLASTADITSGLQLGRAEVLRDLRNFWNMDSPEHYSTERPKEKGVEKGAADIPPFEVGTICV